MPPRPCYACRHFRIDATGRVACDAFPRGIPALMLDGPADHRYPVPGDRGRRFEPAADVPDDVLRALAAVD